MVSFPRTTIVYKTYALVMWFFNYVRVPSSPGGIPARNARGERLLLFVGIIDILQSYRLKKKLEHTWKSMIHDGVSYMSLFLLFSVMIDLSWLFTNTRTCRHVVLYTCVLKNVNCIYFAGYCISTSARFLRATFSRFHGEDSIQKDTVT